MAKFGCMREIPKDLSTRGLSLHSQANKDREKKQAKKIYFFALRRQSRPENVNP
jgi:hypothetical protein